MIFFKNDNKINYEYNKKWKISILILLSFSKRRVFGISLKKWEYFSE
jgi:hypothetical protein